MKLATYYRQEENTFCRLIDLDEEELGAYDQIFFFSEIAKEITIPPAFRAAKNVIYGGSNFTNKQYKPFENEIIDYTIAKPFIYKEILKQRFQNGAKAKQINHLIDDSYYRMYAGDKKMPVPPTMSNKRIFLFDRDIFYPDWKETLTEIIERKPSSIVPIHPIYCKTLTNFFEVRNFSKLSRKSTTVLALEIPLSEVPLMFKKYTNKFLAEVTKHSSVFLELGGTRQTSYEYYKDFVYKMNLLYSFWARKIPIKIRYEDSLTHNNPIQDLEREVVFWADAEIVDEKNVTLESRLHGHGKKPTKSKQHLRDQRDKILRFFPKSTSIFQQSYIDLTERRIWRM